MHAVMLRSRRAGFTLVEVLIALTLTAVLGAAVTGAFVSQSRFFDRQEKVGAARNVSRSAINIIMSELRMVERSGGVTAATNSAITLRVPYAMGLYCNLNVGTMRISRLPADSAQLASAVYSGYAFRTSASTYTYVPGTLPPTPGTAGSCTASGVTELAGGGVMNVPLGTPLTVATPVFLYQLVTYEFKASTMVPGRIGLYRRVVGAEEELLAPFDTTAMFRFYESDAAVPQTAVPGTLSNITGIELVLDGLSERPNGDGTFQRVELSTSVFFRNR
jgi:prepilin-type N-terminal cleavage/methylation domain-containing protein